jgi:hypothetical protein
VLPPEGVEGQHCEPVRLLAEPIHCHRGLNVPEGSTVIALAERHLRGVDPRLEDASLVDTAELERPLGIGLVIEHLAPHERESTPNDAR